eukprot:3524104-Pyramimonas_sp.AAC.1
MDAMTALMSNADLSAARTIQAPWVGSAGSPLSSVKASAEPTPPASEKHIQAILPGSRRHTIRPLEDVDQ